MQTSQHNKLFHDQLIEEHKVLHSVLGQILHAMKELSLLEGDEEGWDETLKQALDLIKLMQEHLQEHFAFEEKDGYLIDAIERAPWLSDEADTLEEEHRAFINRLSDIQTRIEKFNSITDDFSEIVEDFSDIVSDLHKHENQENHLMLLAFTDDIGTGD